MPEPTNHCAVCVFKNSGACKPCTYDVWEGKGLTHFQRAMPLKRAA